MKRLAILATISILALTASAFNFMVDGIAYNRTSNNTVEVASGGNYSGSLTIPSSVIYGGTTYSVTKIGSWVFANCSGLMSVTIPNSVTSIGDEVFFNCTGLESITVESGNAKYDSRNNCNAIIESASKILIAGCKNTVIPNSVTSIGKYAYYGCTSLTSVSIPNSVITIDDYAFSDCNGLTSVNIGNSVTSIGNSAFFRCTGLTSLTIGNSVTSIGNRAFQNCSGLTSVNIPNSVTSISHWAFVGCSELTEIRSKIVDVSKVTLGSDVFKNVSTSSCILKVRAGTAASYRNAEQWNAFTNIQEAIIYKSGTVGDLNCDNVVNGEDINLLVELIIRKIKYETIEDEDGAADLNGDGVVNGIDLHLMINIILGI